MKRFEWRYLLDERRFFLSFLSFIFSASFFYLHLTSFSSIAFLNILRERPLITNYYYHQRAIINFVIIFTIAVVKQSSFWKTLQITTIEKILQFLKQSVHWIEHSFEFQCPCMCYYLHTVSFVNVVIIFT